MILEDLHAHTYFCDGKNSPEEMVQSAISKGLKKIGLVVHSFTDFDTSYCVSKDGEKEFKRQMNALKKQYADKIQVLCGVEQDVYSSSSTEGFDYVIGSVHYFKVEGKYHDVDKSPESFIKTVNDYFGGDYYSAAECYFESVANLQEKTRADIIGHFDLITKFNQKNVLFDVDNPRYERAYLSALNALKVEKTVFEVNTGAISRGYRQEPYPANKIREQIKNRGGKLLLSSDAHSADNLAFEFSKWEKLL